jgi:hypothetical protein
MSNLLTEFEKKLHNLKFAIRMYNLNCTTGTALSSMPLHFLLRCRVLICIFDRTVEAAGFRLHSKFVDLYITS